MTSRTEDGALAIADRLNADMKNWSFEIVTHLRLDGEVIVLGRLTVDGAIKMAFGSASLPRDGEPCPTSALLATAANVALSRAARLFGVGLVLEPHADRTRTDSPSDGAATPDNRITQKQLGALQGIARRRNLGRMEFAEMLRARFGRGDLISLTKREASELLSELNGSNGHAPT